MKALRSKFIPCDTERHNAKIRCGWGKHTLLRSPVHARATRRQSFQPLQLSACISLEEGIVPRIAAVATALMVGLQLPYLALTVLYHKSMSVFFFNNLVRMF